MRPPPPPPPPPPPLLLLLLLLLLGLLCGCCCASTGSPTPHPPQSCKTHIVQVDDICHNIAKGNGITAGELEWWNPSIQCSKLQIGQILCVSDPSRGGSPPSEYCKTYTVKAGDRCYYIAKDNDITVDELEGWNPGMKCFNLKIGQILCVSDPEGSSPSPEFCKTYTVKAGDKCRNVAKDNGITLEELLWWNLDMQCFNLQIGQILCISDPRGGNPRPKSCKTYTVKEGDRCYYIALHNGITVDELEGWNPGMECSNLQIGQILCVSNPGGDIPPPELSCKTYTVKAGDGCWSIAVHNGIAVEELEWWNPGMECSNLEIGEILCVSDPEGGVPPPESCEPYTVKDGDKCWSIALHNGITLEDLELWNPGIECSNLQIGEILCVSDPGYYYGNIKSQRLVPREGKEEVALHSLA